MNYENTTKKIHSDWKPFFEDTKDQLNSIYTEVNQSMQKYSRLLIILDLNKLELLY